MLQIINNFCFFEILSMNFTLYKSRSLKMKFYKETRVMPEIYFCFQNMAYGFKLFAQEDKSFAQRLQDFELSFEINMEQNRIRLFGY